jgi:hypothetical protein
MAEARLESAYDAGCHDVKQRDGVLMRIDSARFHIEPEIDQAIKLGCCGTGTGRVGALQRTLHGVMLDLPTYAETPPRTNRSSHKVRK